MIRMAETNGTSTSNGPTPPYGSFTTLWNFITELSERGPAPQVLSNELFANRSGASRYEMLVAFRFLGLMHEDRRPTEEGRALIENPSTDRLRTIIERAYPAVIALGLGTATTSQLNEVLRQMGVKEASTLRKARTFFLLAAEKAGIPIGNHLTARAPAGKPMARRAKSTKPKVPRGEEDTGDSPKHARGDLWTRYIEMLMEKASAQETPDEKLLDRIETALKANATQ